MNSSYSVMEKASKWLVGTMFVVALLSVGAGTVFADDPTFLPQITCPTTLTGCNASDMTTSVSDAVPVDGDTCTDPADTITVDLYVSFTSTASTRYDVGFWISTDGDPVNNNGEACVGSIAPIGQGTAPYEFRNEDDPPQTGDICGDVSSDYDPVVWPVRTTIPCEPTPGTSYLQVEACRSWSQNTGAVCTTITEAGTGSKCNCTPLPITQVIVPFAAYITVVKDFIPNTDPGTVDLWIDEGADGSNDHVATNQGDNGTTGKQTVPAGVTGDVGRTHKVGETAYTGTDLSNYISSITCVEAGGTSVTSSGTSMDLTVQPEEDWTCTITNTKLATVQVTKVTIPSPAGHMFNFQIVGATPAVPDFQLTTSTSNGVATQTYYVNPGDSLSVSEIYDLGEAGWTLVTGPTNTFCTIDDSPVGTYAATGTYPNETYTFSSITPTAGQAVVCQFTNQASSAGVTMSDFAAQVSGSDAILVTWETATELGNRGFNLWRGTSAAGPDVKLNEYLIPTQSQGSPDGFVYTWEDQADLVPGTTYWYWLEDLDVSGALTRHDPVSVTFGAPNAVGLSNIAAGAAAGPALAGLAGLALAVLGGVAVRRRR